MKSTDDNILAALANQGNAAAFSTLLERHYELIYRLAYRLLRSREDAEDLTQDVCVKLPAKLRAFEGRAKFTTWLYQLTLNACRDFWRRGASRRNAHASYAEISEIRRDTQDRRRLDVATAYELIDTLNDDLRETAMLVVAEGLNHAEAADILGIKESSVSWRMLKVRENLSALIQREGGTV